MRHAPDIRQESPCRHRAAGQSGLSLIELMVALAIGAFLVLGIVTVFLANKNSSELETSLARLQENGRFALDLISEDILQAQYLGCNTGEVFVMNMVDDPNSPVFSNSLEGIRAYEHLSSGSWASSPSLPSGMTTGASSIDSIARVGSDVLGVRTSRLVEGAELAVRVLPGGSQINLDSNPGCAISQGDRVIVTGCYLTAHMFEVTNSLACTSGTEGDPVTLQAGSSANATTTFNTSYGDADVTDGDDAVEVLLYEEVFWFVADTGRERNGLPVFALYREANGQRQEMIEGVEHMQLKFGQRVYLSDTIRYIDPSDATLNLDNNYEGVNSVRLALMVQSFDRVKSTTDDDNYMLLDTTIPAGASDDAHSGGAVLREVFSTTVKLRNAPEM